MLNLLTPYWRDLLYLISSLAVTMLAAGGLYIIFFYLLRSLFRQFERDIALVTLNVSTYPALTLFILICLKITRQNSSALASLEWLSRLLLGGIILAASYWSLRLFEQVLVYYLKEYAESTEAMWDEVLIPLLEGVVPIVIVLAGGSAILEFCFGFDLTGAWLTLGGGAFVVGFAVKDILANFFSGIVLLLDSPFQFGDVLKLESDNDAPSQMGILKKIGVRVTHLYMFESHTEVYIPNSVVQSHKITNLSRPIEPIHFSTPIEFSLNCDLEQARQIITEIIQAHPDTLGNIETKLLCLENYYNWEDGFASFQAKKENGRQRLLAESAVNEKLDEIEQALEALILTLGFLEKGGLDPDDITTVRQEYEYVLELVGLAIVLPPTTQQRSFLFAKQPLATFELEETQDAQSLISLVREWYRLWLRDPNVADKDEYVLPEIWERKIDLLRKRSHRLYSKILRPLQEETRIDDYVRELVGWLRDRFKQARSAWQEPAIRMERVVHDEGYAYIRFTLGYYVDDIRLEDGERGTRVNSDIHREIMRHLKDDCRGTALPQSPPSTADPSTHVAMGYSST
ncbi:MAG: mechanosensitive ion channel family protein [Cyanobacteria bacterium P01_H01_bin.58]